MKMKFIQINGCKMIFVSHSSKNVSVVTRLLEKDALDAKILQILDAKILQILE